MPVDHQIANVLQQLISCCDEAFQTKSADALIKLADRTVPPFPFDSDTTSGSEQTIVDSDDAKTLQSGPLTLKVTSDFGIRIYYQDKQITTDKENIPLSYPWFQYDPVDPDNIADYATRHVGRGSRGESPWPEDQWPKIGGVRQGEQNWPHRDVAFGPYQLQIANKGSVPAILLSHSDKPNAYGVVLKGIFLVNSPTSVTMALKHFNSGKENLSWAPWFVLGFAMPAHGTILNPSVVLAIPDDEHEAPLQSRMTKVWNYTEINGNRVALINPHAKTLNETFKKFYANVNWTAIAIKGADHIIVTRSILKHPEQFFPFLEHGKYFIEVEHTGPRVPPGESSAVLVKHDFVSLSALTQGGLMRFSEEPQVFEDNVRTALAALIRYIA